jgi:triphosphoribosyl-dephospho-CoA synthase
MTSPLRLPIGVCATLACQWEATAPKPGNVHRGADFDDLRFTDFLSSAAAIAPILEQAPQQTVGATVLAAIQATRRIVATNTNLGIVLLLAPLAGVPREESIATGVAQRLAKLTPADAEQVYAAIRIAQPGGLGEVPTMDVAAEPPADLLAAMQAAADRDAIALQYVTNFSRVLKEIVPGLLTHRTAGLSLTEAIIRTQLEQIAKHGDSLIERKSGREINQQAQFIADQCLQTLKLGESIYYSAVSDFDFWLRSDGRRRNPGTTADLIAAALFVIFRDDLWPPVWE